MPDYVKNLRDILKSYNVTPETGRTARQASSALEKHGENKLAEPKHTSALGKFLLQLNDIMVIILIAAAIISFVVAMVEKTGEYIDSVIILAIVVLNGVIGVKQESRAEKALDALKDLSAPAAKVLRDGTVQRIPSAQVVPGDIVLLEAGDYIPADGRLIEAVNLKCEESALTGESVPADKDTEAVIEKNAPLGDRVNMVYSGCSVSGGRAKLVVTATGMNTEMGKIAALLENTKTERTPLQMKLAQFGKYMGFIVIGICALIFGIGFLRKMDLMTMFMTSVSLAVAAIPEGLTAVVTVVLALGVQSMVKKNAIIRRLTAVETLGSASVICSDKTGTLTQNRMTVMKLWTPGAAIEDMGETLSARSKNLIALGTLCNDGRIETAEGVERAIGDPTETAIVAAAFRCGLQKENLDAEFKRVAEIPFDSNRKLMTTVHQNKGKLIAVVKGGYDVLLPLCKNPERTGADEANLAMAENALRVLAVACRELEDKDGKPDLYKAERELTFIGLIGMIDPPREESAEAVELCRRAGIKTVMITGDHITTASAIARQLGILENDGQAISGRQLAEMTQERLTAAIGKYRVYARVSPEDKIRIVKAWQAKGEVVAMTGDGVNDAPALKAADIGCAMGITGTDVAKGAADTVLTDDNFSTIVEAVKSGRGIYDNIKKTIMFLLGSNLGEIFTVLISILLGWGAPLLAIHLLLVNVVTDALPALALGVEPLEKDVMSRKPTPKSEGIFAHGLGITILIQGVMIGVLTLAGYYIGERIELSTLYPPSHGIGMTMAFLVLALSQLVHAVNCRSRDSIFKIGFLSNKMMLKAIACSLFVVLLICLVPPLEKVFRISDLSMMHWVAVAVLSFIPFVAVELAKFGSGLWGRKSAAPSRP